MPVSKKPSIVSKKASIVSKLLCRKAPKHNGNQRSFMVTIIVSRKLPITSKKWNPLVTPLRENWCEARKAAERKFPEFFEFSSRILPRISLRIFPEFFEDFSCFVSWETETRKNSPKIPAIFQCKIPRQTRKKYSQNSSGEQAK